MIAEAYVGLGSNLGDREGNITAAIELVRGFATGVTVSSLHETRPSGFLSQPAFLNAAARIRTRLDPFELFPL